ncbi:MAG: GlsB/YeaQ/YmgE family stress response membrane protein [bacterium]|nr:GlsB/YeaQ/YmgE family stress response membrane protein [bacterium]
MFDFIGDIVAAPFLCIGWIIAAAIAGALAHSIMRSNAPLITDIILGFVGVVIGNIILGLLRVYRPEGGIVGYIASIVVGVIGGVILIAISRALSGRRAV